MAKEGECGVFCGELSKPDAAVDWRKGRVVLRCGEKYQMKQEGRFIKLIINNVEESDAGIYTCKTNDCQSSAELTVKGENVQFGSRFLLKVGHSCGQTTVTMHNTVWVDRFTTKFQGATHQPRSHRGQQCDSAL